LLPLGTIRREDPFGENSLVEATVLMPEGYQAASFSEDEEIILKMPASAKSPRIENQRLSRKKSSKPAAAAAENLDSSVEILENDEDDVQMIDNNFMQKKVLHATDSTSESDDRNSDQDRDYIPKKFRHDDGTDVTSESDDRYSARKKNFIGIRRSNRKKTYKPPADSTSESEDE
jgi:hypothetical protein